MRWFASIAAIAVLVAPAAARADDLVAAANAFEEGQRAQLRKEYARAAELFEIADRAAPSAVALRSAIRNHQAAGNDTSAATLALRAQQRYPTDAQTMELAARALKELGPKLGRLDLSCKPACTMTMDGRALHGVATTSSVSIYVKPGTHGVTARWSDRPLESRPIEIAAGETRAVRIEGAAPPPVAAAPPPPAPEPAVKPDATRPAPAPLAVAAEVTPEETRPLPPLVVYVGAGATVAAAAVLVWSGLDTLSARDAYVADPTQAGFEDGTSRETRTNVLIGVTAGVALLTAVAASFFTDWGRF